MPDLTEIPATFESSPTEIPATFESEVVEIPATYDEGAPDAISQSIRSAKSQDEAIQLALPHFNSPDRINLSIQSLAEKKKADDARTGMEKVSDLGSAMLKIPGVGVDLFKHIREGVLPAVAQAVADIVDPLSTPAQIRDIYANAGDKMSAETLKRLAQEKRQDLNRGAARSAAEVATSVKSTSLQTFEILRNAISKAGDATAAQTAFNVAVPGGQLISDIFNLNAPGVTRTDDEYRKRAFEDLVAAQSIREAAEGRFTESAAETAAAGYPIRPEQVQGLETAVDLTNLVPGFAGAKAGAVAAKAEVAARALRSAAAAPKQVGALRKAVGAGLETTGKRLVSASDSPVATGLLAGTAAAASGLDPSGVALATILGSSNKSMGIASSVLEKGGNKLLRMAGKAQGTVALGPLGAAVELTGQFFDDTIREGAKDGLLASLPFVAGQKDEEGAINVATTGAAFGATGAATAKAVSTVANAARSFPLDNFFRDRSADRPDTDYIAPEFTHYSDDHSNVLEAASRSIFDSLSNKDKQNFEALKTLVGAPDANGVATQIFAVDRQTGDAFVKQAGLRDQLGAGVTIEPNPGQTVRTILINVDAENGIAAGHEVGHAVEMSLPAEIRKQLYDLVDPNSKKSLVDRDDFEGLRQYYETLFNRRRNPDGTFIEVPQNERRTFDDAAVVSEYIAENFSAFLNGVPPGKLGTPRPLVDRMRLQLGAMLEKAGSRRLTTQGESKLQSKLGLKPSFALAQAFQNYLEAGRLDNLRLPGEPPVLIRPPEAPTERATNAPTSVNAPASPLANIREVEAKPVVPGFKKGDPIGEIRDREGMLIAEDAKVLRKNEDGTYEIEFIDPDTGKRLIATTDEASLVSPISPGKVDPNKTVFPASPVTPQTPFGAAVAPTPATAATTVAPKQVENVARPQASTPTLRPGAADAFVKKADDPLHLEVRKTLADTLKKPRSEREVLETDYYSAASTMENPDGIIRDAQRAAADAVDRTGKPNPFRQIFKKLFVPFKWSIGKLDPEVNARLYGASAELQPSGVFGMSVDKVGQNLKMVQGLALSNPEIARVLESYGVGEAYLNGNEIVADFQSYLENHSNGYGGGGEKLVRPASTTPGSVTPETPGYVPTKLSTEKRQLFNLILGFEQKQNRTAKMAFHDLFAKQNGIDPLVVGFDAQGKPLTDTNALRAALRQKGLNIKLLNSGIEQLGTEKFTTPLKVREDIRFPAADTGIGQAGFMPEIASPDSTALKEVRDSVRTHTGRGSVLSWEAKENYYKSLGLERSQYQIGLPEARRREATELLKPQRERFSTWEKEIDRDTLAKDPAKMARFKEDLAAFSSSFDGRIFPDLSTADPRNAVEFVMREAGVLLAGALLAGKIKAGGFSSGKAILDGLKADYPTQFVEVPEVAAFIFPGGEVLDVSALPGADAGYYHSMADYSPAFKSAESENSPERFQELTAAVRWTTDLSTRNMKEIREGREWDTEENRGSLVGDIGISFSKPLTKSQLDAVLMGVVSYPKERVRISIDGPSGFERLDIGAEERDVRRALAKVSRPSANPQAGFMPEAGGPADRATLADFSPDKVDGILSKKGWAILTAENPDGKPASPEQNAKLLAGLKNDLTEQGLDFEPVAGKYGSEENSLLVFDEGMSLEKAQELANKYRQDAVLVPEGFVYRDGSLLPASGVETYASAPEDFYSKIGDTFFSVKFGREFGDTLAPDSPEVQALRDRGAYMPEAPDTPAFKKWFGDWQDPKAFTSRAKGPVSQVVDWKAGDYRPLRVYHSSVGDFNAFESGRPTFDDMGLFGNVETNRNAIFFSDSPEQANSYVENSRGKPHEGAKTYPVYLDIKSPADFTRADPWTLAEEAGFNGRWIQNKQTWELFDGKEGKEFVEGLKKAGYDGAIFKEDAVREGVTPGTTFAVFEPTQIKSATGNRGTFDATNPDIRFLPEVQFDAPKKLPHAIGGRPITLVHRGNAGLSEIDPARFGKSGITPRSELSGAPRSYYYVKGLENKSDPVMGRGSKYEIPVSGKRIYDADTDNLDWTQQINRWKADDMLKAAGYVGLSRTRGTGKNKFQQVELFEKLKVPAEGRFMPEGRSVPESKRKVEEAAIRFDGEIFTGATHYDAFEQMREQGFADESADTGDLPTSALGFVDNKGKFLTRTEAANLAESSGQLDKEGVKNSIWELPEGRSLEAEGFEENRRFMPEVEVLPNEELARGIDIDPTPADELNEGDAKIDWSAAFMPETIPGVFPLIDKKLLEQIKSETPTVAAIHIDRMRVGSYKGIELQGGMFYPAIKENVDKGVVWAFNSKATASGVAKRAAANGGYVKLVLMAEGNVVGNKTFTNVWFNDVREAIESGDLKEKRALTELNRVRRNFASDTDHKTKWETLEQAQKDIVDMPQMLRGSTYFQKTKVVTKGDGEKVQYGSLLTKALTSVGFPDAVQLVSALEEPAFKGVPQGAAVAVVKFDPIKDKSEIKTAEEAGVPEHMSYKYVLKGRPVARLENYSVVDADYPEIRRLIMSQQKKDFPVGRALLPDVAAGQINYGLQDATITPRKAAEAPLADEGVVSLPERGLADATVSPRNK
jgi:hypothetical protein